MFDPNAPIDAEDDEGEKVNESSKPLKKMKTSSVIDVEDVEMGDLTSNRQAKSLDKSKNE